MKINGIKATDYKAIGSELELVFIDTTMDDIAAMDTSIITVRTDDGDLVEIMSGFSLSSVTFDVVTKTFITRLVRSIDDTTAVTLKALNERLAAQEAAQTDIMLAIAELASVVVHDPTTEVAPGPVVPEAETPIDGGTGTEEGAEVSG